MNELRDYLNSELTTINNNQKNKILLITIIFVVLYIVMALFDFIYDLPKENQIYLNSKKIIYLAPVTTLITEETFYKLAKAVTGKLSIVK